MTVILGLEIEAYKEHTRIIGLIISIPITVLNTISIFFEYKGVWISYTKTQNELHKIRDDLNFHLKGKDDSNIEVYMINNFKIKLDNALGKINAKWEKIRDK